jgi:hypothetical protein
MKIGRRREALGYAEAVSQVINYLRQGGAAEDGGGDVGVGDGPGQRELCDVAAELFRQVLQLACTLQQYHAHPRHAMIVPVIRGR